MSPVHTPACGGGLGRGLRPLHKHGAFSSLAPLADLGGTALGSSPADFGKLIADETEKWAKVVKFSGEKAD
jgi:hypothetical protein